MFSEASSSPSDDCDLPLSFLPLIAATYTITASTHPSHSGSIISSTNRGFRGVCRVRACARPGLHSPTTGRAGRDSSASPASAHTSLHPSLAAWRWHDFFMVPTASNSTYPLETKWVSRLETAAQHMRDLVFTSSRTDCTSTRADSQLVTISMFAVQTAGIYINLDSVVDSQRFTGGVCRKSNTSPSQWSCALTKLPSVTRAAGALRIQS